MKEKFLGMGLCFLVALVAMSLGRWFPMIGGPVFAILIGMVLTRVIKNKQPYEAGVTFTSKKILQYAVILLGFGMNLEVVMETGKQSLPIIICTILTSLVVAYILNKKLKLPSKVATLIGVGSSICGGSAIAATAPVIEADEEEVAQAISVIFLFNILAALIFPALGSWLGFSTANGDAFGVFAGTAVNDMSSVTATASTWDSIYQLGSQTLDKAVSVKLTRTLAIIPITLTLALQRARRCESEQKVSLKKVFPFFILFFIGASVITTVAVSLGTDIALFDPFKDLSKFLIIMAMAAIGFHTDVVKLLKSGGKPVLLGFSCWVGITAVALGMQWLLHIW